MITHLAQSPPSLLAVLQRHFPETGSRLGKAAVPPPIIDRAELRADLADVAARMRKRTALITSVVILWFTVQLAVALLTKNPYASVVALGAAAGGTLWCIATLQRLAKSQFFVDMMTAAASRDPEALRVLVEVGREQLRTTAELPRKKRGAASRHVSA
jgi:hypothetical protein